MKNRWIFIILTALTFVACKKDNDGKLRIEGKISDRRNGTGVSSVRVNLKEQVVEGGSFSSTFTQSATTTTAGNGTYEVEFERKNAAAYEFELKKTGFFDRVYSINPENVTLGDTYTRNGVLTPIATLQLRLLNQTPLNQNDRIRFRHLNANFEDCSCCNNDFVVIDGTNVDSTFQCELHGDFLIKYVWEVTKNDTTTTYVDSLYCPAFMTSNLEIAY